MTKDKLTVALVMAVSLSGCAGAGSIPAADRPGLAGDGASFAAKGAQLSLALNIPTANGAKAGGTFSAKTQSIRVAVNSGQSKVFAVSKSAPGCKGSQLGTLCNFRIAASSGANTLTLQTWSEPGAKGSLLDQAKAIIDADAAEQRVSLGSVVANANDAGAGSLREAVANAAAGETIVVTARTPVTVDLKTGPIVLARNVTIAGPGSNALTMDGNQKSELVTVKPKVAATITGVTLTNGSASTGGAIDNAGNLTLVDDTLSNNFAGSLKGALRKSRLAQPVVLERQPFDPHPARGQRPTRPPRPTTIERPAAAATGLGGAIYNSASLAVIGSTFSHDSVMQGSGGAIYSAKGATARISNTTFSNNIGALGGAVDAEGGATFDSDTFERNTGYPGGGAPVSGAWGYGAAIYANANVTVTECTFTANTAGGKVSASYGIGGAIAQFAGKLAVATSTFDSNVAGGGTNGSWGRGGAIYNGTAAALTLSSDTFSNNEAGGDQLGYGGAVFSVGAIGGTSNTFTANTAYGSASGGSAYGGAVYAQGRVTLKGGLFTTNAAVGGSTKSFGYVYGGAADFEGGSKLTNLSFTKNSAQGGAGGGVAEGGAIFANTGTNAWSAVALTGNKAVASGAQAYSAGGAVLAFAPLTATKAQITSNDATVSGKGVLGGVGGGVAGEVGPLSIAGSVSNNVATTQGGGLWIDAQASIATSTIASNEVASVQNPADGGGGIYESLGGAVTLKTSTLNANSVSGKATSAGGGAIFNEGTLALSNSTIVENTSADDGGGIENESTAGVSLVNVTVYQNVSSSGSGGNIKNLFADAKLTLANSIVAGGTAATGADVSNDGTIASQDYNIVQSSPSGSAFTGSATHDRQVDPQLLALKNNGGPTQTNADQKTSPGTGYIPYSVCSGDGITTDQRGDARSGGGTCDVGAYEYQGN